VIPSVRQIFQRIPSPSNSSSSSSSSSSALELADDARYEYFVNTVFPKIQTTHENHTLIFIPSYLDYVRIRNYLKHRHVITANLCEYTRSAEISRSRSHFFHGNRPFMLLTERLHFFRRYHLRGVHHIIFYGLPENSEFFAELLNFLEQGETDHSCLVLFSKYDGNQLERIVGTERAYRLLTAEKSTHMFC
jgi:U3 small nucleolar RNA-associated protein 25